MNRQVLINPDTNAPYNAGDPLPVGVVTLPAIAGASYTKVVSGVTTLNAAPVNLKEAYIEIEGGSVRVWVDGSNPSATNGFLFLEGEALTIVAAEYATFKAFPVNGTPVLHVEPR